MISGDEDETEGSSDDSEDSDGDEDDGKSSQGLAPGEEPDEETKKEMEEERQRRLDPENRPDNAEVDNTQREFDVEKGQFKDSEEYDENEPAPFKDPEDPNTSRRRR